MCVNLIGVACNNVERMCIIDLAGMWKPEIARLLASPRGAEGYLT